METDQLSQAVVCGLLASRLYAKQMANQEILGSTPAVASGSCPVSGTRHDEEIESTIRDADQTGTLEFVEK